MAEPELMRLKIPSGWVICDNKFIDTDAIGNEDGFISDHYGWFDEDMIWIQECKFDGEVFKVPSTNCFSIDVGWYPSNMIEGEYRAKLLWFGFEELFDVEVFKTKNRFDLRDKLEYWMSDIFENYQSRHDTMKSKYNNSMEQ